MSISGYIEVSDFTNSSFYCAFSECCSLTGVAENILIQELINSSTALIDRYLGRSMWEQDYIDRFKGHNLNVYHTELIPVNSINSITYKTVRPFQKQNHYNNVFNQVTGIISSYELVNPRSGLIETDYGFEKCYRYTVSYNAGYNNSTMPEVIKTATKMLVAQLSQQIDTGNIVNPDLNYNSLKFDTTSFSFGASKYIKNLIIKNIDEVNFLPLSIQAMLRAYKYSKRLY